MRVLLDVVDAFQHDQRPHAADAEHVAVEAGQRVLAGAGAGHVEQQPVGADAGVEDAEAAVQPVGEVVGPAVVGAGDRADAVGDRVAERHDRGLGAALDVDAGNVVPHGRLLGVGRARLAAGEVARAGEVRRLRRGRVVGDRAGLRGHVGRDEQVRVRRDPQRPPGRSSASAPAGTTTLGAPPKVSDRRVPGTASRTGGLHGDGDVPEGQGRGAEGVARGGRAPGRRRRWCARRCGSRSRGSRPGCWPRRPRARRPRCRPSRSRRARRGRPGSALSGLALPDVVRMPNPARTAALTARKRRMHSQWRGCSGPGTADQVSEPDKIPDSPREPGAGPSGILGMPDGPARGGRCRDGRSPECPVPIGRRLARIVASWRPRRACARRPHPEHGRWCAAVQRRGDLAANRGARRSATGW